MLRTTIITPEIGLKFDLSEVAEAAGEEMRDFWAGQLDRGQQPDGEPLPKNKEGKPLGRGHGTLVRKWKVRKHKSRVRGGSRVGRATVEPYKGGRYRIAVLRLRQRGLRFHSFEGAAAKVWEAIATKLAADQIEKAITRGRRRAPGNREFSSPQARAAYEKRYGREWSDQ